MKKQSATSWLCLLGVTGCGLCLFSAISFQYLAPSVVTALYEGEIPDWGVLKGKDVYTLEFYLHRLELLGSQTLFPLLLTASMISALLIPLNRTLSRDTKSPLRLNILIFLIFSLLSFFSAEVLLRLFGYFPDTREVNNVVSPDSQANPRFIFKPHPQLGWVNTVGTFTDPLFYGASTRYAITVNNQGNRITAHQKSNSQRQILFAGCSITFGSCVEDSQTLPFLTQNYLPDFHVINLGVAAYGTYQSLLRTKEYLSNSADSVAAIIYPYFDDHLARNVASSLWQSRLKFRLSSQETPRLPFARIKGKDTQLLDTGILAPERPSFIEYYSSLAHLGGSVARRLRATNFDEHTQQETAISLLKEFATLATQHRAQFFVLDIFTPSMVNPDRPYRKKLEALGISVIDCQIPLDDFSYKISGDGHPNAKAHQHWADCVYSFFSKVQPLP